MRPGNGQVAAAEPRSVFRPNLQVSGSGERFLGRELWDQQDYNPLLHGGKALEIYEKMRSTDGEIAGGLWRLTAPLYSSPWQVEAPEGEDAETHKPTLLCRKMLFESADDEVFSSTWTDVLRHLLLMVPFGFSALEKVWGTLDGYQAIVRLSPILPRTVYKFTFGPDGVLKSLTQRAWMLDTGAFESRTIPDPETGGTAEEKLVLAVFGREGRNMFGRSVLRTAWVHWHYKRGLIETDGIRGERSGIGIPWVEIPQGYVMQAGDKEAIEAVTKNLRSHESQYVYLPPGMKLHVDYASGAEPKTLESIKYHDQQESRSLLSEFMATGTSESGSRAVVASKMDFMLMAAQGVVRLIEDVVNRQIFGPVVRRNWGAGAKVPRLQGSDLDKMSGTQRAEIMKMLAEVGLLLPDRTLRKKLRDELELPPEDDADGLAPGSVGGVAKPGEPAGGRVGAAATSESLAIIRFQEARPLAREPMPHERYCAFSEYARFLDQEPVRVWNGVVKSYKDRMVLQVAEDASRASDGDLVGGEIASGGLFPKLRSWLERDLGKALMRTYSRGRKSVVEERDRQLKGEPVNLKPLTAQEEDEPDIEPTPSQRRWTRRLAEVFVTGLVTSLVAEARRAGTLSRNADRGREEQRADVASALSELSEARMIAALGGEINRAFVNGRNEQAGSMASDVESEYYSAIMDNGTCGPCAALDGQEQEPGADDFTTPNPECEGGDRCRCITIYVFKEQKLAA